MQPLNYLVQIKPNTLTHTHTKKHRSDKTVIKYRKQYEATMTIVGTYKKKTHRTKLMLEKKNKYLKCVRIIWLKIYEYDMYYLENDCCFCALLFSFFFVFSCLCFILTIITYRKQNARQNVGWILFSTFFRTMTAMEKLTQKWEREKKKRER